MSSEGLVVIQVDRRKSKESLSVQFSFFGLPRFEDYLEEFKANAERYLNNETKRKDIFNMDEFERFCREDLYSICGKKPIINVVGLE